MRVGSDDLTPFFQSPHRYPYSYKLTAPVFPRDKKPLIYAVRGVCITVAVNISRPVRPMLFRCFKGEKSPGIHILETVFFDKIGKIFFKTLYRVGKSRRRFRSIPLRLPLRTLERRAKSLLLRRDKRRKLPQP